MAKTKTVQLQIDITTEDEWEKFLQRDGLLVVDIYSEWCGPCLAMQGNLKKIKLESGGDFLQLGMARSNQIEALKRFVNKSEPTWMFIAQGQQVGLLFGSNAPELQRMIMDEMKNEKDCLEGSRQRIQRLPSEFSEHEQHVYEAGIKQHQEREQIKLEKQNRQTKDRRIAQAKNILDTMAHLGLIIIFPHATRRGVEIIEEYIPNTGLAISKKERPQLTEDAVADIEYLAPLKMPEEVRKHLVADRSMALMLTVDQEMSPGPVDESVLKFVYGESKLAPGDEDTPGYALLKSQLTKRLQEEIEAVKAKELAAMAPVSDMAEETVELVEAESVEDEGMGEEVEGEEEEEMLKPAPSGIPGGIDDIYTTVSQGGVDADIVEEEVEEEEVEESEEAVDLWGIWAPQTDLVKATALMYCFPLITSALVLPDVEPTPPHLAIAFEVFKKHDVYKLMDEYNSDIMAYGFFSSDQPDEARLIAKTKKAYEKQFTGTNFGEKLVIKIAKKKSDPILAFAQLGPTYMSSNVDTGEKDCSFFFPENYEDQEPEKLPSEIVMEREDLQMESTGDYQDMVFEGVLHGEADEDLEEFGDEVEEIPPVRMSELPQVEAEDEEEEGQGEAPPRISKMKAKSMASKMVMKSVSQAQAAEAPAEGAAPAAEGETPPPAEGEAPPAVDGEAAPAAEGEAPPAAEGEALPAAEGEAPPPAEEAPTEAPPPEEGAPPAEAEAAPPAEEAPPAEAEAPPPAEEAPPPEKEEEEEG